MALKAKHEQLVYDQILTNFTLGHPITAERKYLIQINENMKFAGGPTDKAYAKKVIDVAKNRYRQEKMKGKLALEILQQKRKATRTSPLEMTLVTGKKGSPLMKKEGIGSEAKHVKLKNWRKGDSADSINLDSIMRSETYAAMALRA